MAEAAAQSPRWADRYAKGARTGEQTGKKNLLRVATYNVMNVSARTGDPDPSNQDRLDRLANSIIHDLDSPHLIALQEVQDNDGPDNTGNTDASETLKRLCDAIVAQGGPRYRFSQIDPEEFKDGGQPGANIRQAFLYDADRLELYRSRDGKGDSSTPCDVVSDAAGVHLSRNPGRIDPKNPCFDNSRKPLVAEFVDKLSGRSLFAINVHLISKRSENPGSGRKREERAKVVADFVDALDVKLDAAGQDKAYIVLGDYNSQAHETPIEIIADGTKRHNLAEGLEDHSYFTYVHQGQRIAIDHIIASVDLKSPTGAHAMIVNTNKSRSTRVSDHNPVRTDILLKRKLNQGDPPQSANTR